jgi:hypothetical protein
MAQTRTSATDTLEQRMAGTLGRPLTNVRTENGRRFRRPNLKQKMAVTSGGLWRMLEQRGRPLSSPRTENGRESRQCV